MAKVTLKNGADPLEVTEELKRIGITKGQMLPNGQMVVYINQRTYMCRLYPKLIPLYQEDRRFWKNVRKRTRNGEDVPQSEIQAHADYFKKCTTKSSINMKKKKKITLCYMLNRLQERMNYEEPEIAFDTLLYSWNKHRGASSASLASIKQRGTMSTTLARSFAEYCGYPIDRKA